MVPAEDARDLFFTVRTGDQGYDEYDLSSGWKK